MNTVYYWPDGCLCYSNERQQFPFKNDEFDLVWLPLTMTKDQIDILVEQLVAEQSRFHVVGRRMK